MTKFDTAFLASAGAVAALGSGATAFEPLDDDALLRAQDALSVHRRHLDVYFAWVAGEIARRSRRDTGYAGLAQRRGFASAEALIQSMSQATRAEAGKFVQLGSSMAQAASALRSAEAGIPVELPWQAPIAAGLSTGRLSADAAESIRRGLGDPDAAVTAAVLADAAGRLVDSAGELTVDQLYHHARQTRDELDADGIATREKQRYEHRYLKRWIRQDGMYQASMLLDPESGRQLFSALDAILAPRRGGPRFVDPREQERADALLADPRTDEQLALDSLVAMVRIATEADDQKLFGAARPAVRVVVTETTLATGKGHGYLEGEPDPVSLATIERYHCDAGVVGVKFDDDGQCVNVGRDQRLFTARQRIGMAVRDDGCRFPGCDRPPSWCEAHHIDQWHRDRGRTDLADGILLCRFHHMLIHNDGWRIVRESGRYWLRPPRAEDPHQRPREMPSRSGVVRELAGARS